MNGRMVYLSETPPNEDRELFKDYPDVMGVSEVKDALGLSEATVRREIQRGMLRATHAGARVLVTKTALLEYLGEVTA